jgi:hypothetical protein
LELVDQLSQELRVIPRVIHDYLKVQVLKKQGAKKILAATNSHGPSQEWLRIAVGRAG